MIDACSLIYLLSRSYCSFCIKSQVFNLVFFSIFSEFLLEARLQRHCNFGAFRSHMVNPVNAIAGAKVLEMRLSINKAMIR